MKMMERHSDESWSLLSGAAMDDGGFSHQHRQLPAKTIRQHEITVDNLDKCLLIQDLTSHNDTR